MATCTKDHAAGSLPAAFAKLPESQAGKWRHLCAACAYELGKADGAKTEQNLRERVRALSEENAELRAQLAKKP